MCIACDFFVGFSSPLSSVDEMNVQTTRALRPRAAYTDPLATISDQEWFVVEPDGRIRLEHLDAAEEVGLVRPDPLRVLVQPLRQNNGKRGFGRSAAC